MAKLSELESKLTAVNDKLTKATAEIVAEVKKLTDALEATEIPDGAQASLDKLETLAQALDDLNADAPPPAPATPA